MSHIIKEIEKENYITLRHITWHDIWTGQGRVEQSSAVDDVE